MISHHHKYIFVHIPKTGGTSIERTLQRNEPESKNSDQLLLGKNDDPASGPPELMHLKAQQYFKLNHLDENIYDDYFKFAIVRNPWDRVASFYKYFNYCRRFNFKTYVMKYLKKDIENRGWLFDSQHRFLTDRNGELIVDYIGRFESLQDHFNSICDKLDLKHNSLTHFNKSNPSQYIKLNFSTPAVYKNMLRNVARYLYKDKIKRNLRKNYRDYYDQETIEYVNELYRIDVNYFNYHFSPEIRNYSLVENL